MQIGNRQLPIVNIRNCGREVRHLIVDQADDGSSPFSSAITNKKRREHNNETRKFMHKEGANMK